MPHQNCDNAHQKIWTLPPLSISVIPAQNIPTFTPCYLVLEKVSSIVPLVQLCDLTTSPYNHLQYFSVDGDVGQSVVLCGLLKSALFFLIKKEDLIAKDSRVPSTTLEGQLASSLCSKTISSSYKSSFFAFSFALWQFLFADLAFTSVFRLISWNCSE